MNPPRMAYTDVVIIPVNVELEVSHADVELILESELLVRYPDHPILIEYMDQLVEKSLGQSVTIRLGNGRIVRRRETPIIERDVELELALSRKGVGEPRVDRDGSFNTDLLAQ